MSEHKGPIFSSAVLSSGDLASASLENQNIRIWNSTFGSQKLLISTNDSSEMFFFKNGDLSSANFNVRIWNTRTGALKKTLNTNANVYSLEILPNGDLTCGASTGQIEIR